MNTHTLIIRTLCCVGLLASNSLAYAEEFGGIEFPGGVSSFADKMVSYEPNFSGGSTPAACCTDAGQASGPPDYNSSRETGIVSLGSGGRVTLQFVDNLLTGSDSDDPDLHIFEVGPDVESTFVEISKDGVNFTSVGKVAGGVANIDIDAFGFTSADQFAYVRLMDDPNSGGSGGTTPGADIDAVGAIHTVKNTATDPGYTTCQKDELLVHYEYLGACGLTQSTDFSLASTSTVDKIRIWYNTNIGSPALTVNISSANGYNWSGMTTLGGCDTYQKNWCEGLVMLNTQLAAGTYTVAIDSTSMCANPNGLTTLLVYGCPLSSSGSTVPSSCVATYSNDGKLHIPYVTVPDAFGGTAMYEADLQLVPFSSPFNFQLTGAKAHK